MTVKSNFSTIKSIKLSERDALKTPMKNLFNMIENKEKSTLKKESVMSIRSKAKKVKPTKANIVVVPFSNLKLTGEPLLSKSPSNRSNLTIVRENEITTGAYNISLDDTLNDSSKPLEFFVGLPSPQ